MNGKKRVSVRITGYVQGVGFRYFCQRRARELGICGWVRNLPGGAVELEAQGAPGPLEEFLKRVRTGPPGATVKSIRIDEIPTDETCDEEFDIGF